MMYAQKQEQLNVKEITTTSGFVHSKVHIEVVCKRPIHRVWNYLNRMDTFTKGQIPPYRVEFLPKEGEKEPSFSVGTYNNHHGPFLNLPAVITNMQKNTYREMRYLYGSYVGSFHLVRPTSLRLTFVKADNNHTLVIVELHSEIRPWLKSTWEFLNMHLWKRFLFPSVLKL